MTTATSCSSGQDSSPDAPWVVYMLVNQRGHTYVGITTDVHRRIRQHNGEIGGGAKATHDRGTWRLLHLEPGYLNRSAAQSREYRLKKDRSFRRSLVRNETNRCDIYCV